MDIKDSHGFWKLLTILEADAAAKISKELQPFSGVITDLYECGVEVSTLVKPSMRQYLGATGLFLKKLLNDIRAVWILISLGYTSQAACVTAAAMENALIVYCITSDHERAKKVMKKGSSPWSVFELCRIHARGYEWLKKEKKTDDDIDLATASRGDYAVYQWVCNFKHPHMASALHDAYSVSIEDTYGVMAAPDDRIEDLANKVYILLILINHGCEAIRSLVEAKAVDEENPQYDSWYNRFSSISDSITELQNKYHGIELPFDYMGRMKRS